MSQLIKQELRKLKKDGKELDMVTLNSIKEKVKQKIKEKKHDL